MGIISVEQADHLYWLGRYTERVYTTLRIYSLRFDEMLDRLPDSYEEFCESIDIPNIYTSRDDFFERYPFDKTNPDSLISNLDRAYDNAIVLRESISSAALSYIQMAVNIMEAAAKGVAPMLELQSVTDMLYAFRSCSDDSILDMGSRYTLKCGYSVERIDMYVRLGHHLENLRREFSRLNHRMQCTPLRRDGEKLMLLLGLAPNPDPENNRKILLECIEGLFVDV